VHPSPQAESVHVRLQQFELSLNMHFSKWKPPTNAWSPTLGEEITWLLHLGEYHWKSGKEMHNFGLASLPTPSIMVLWFPLLNNGKKPKTKQNKPPNKTPKWYTYEQFDTKWPQCVISYWCQYHTGREAKVEQEEGGSKF